MLLLLIAAYTFTSTEANEIVNSSNSITATKTNDNDANNDRINNSTYELKYVDTDAGTGYDLL